MRKWTRSVRWRRALSGIGGSSDTSRKSMPFSCAAAPDGVARGAVVAAEGSSLTPLPARVNCATCSSHGSRERCTAPSPAASSRRWPPRHSFTSIRSPSHCCSAPCTRNCVAAASSSLFGANTSCSSAAAEVGPVDALARQREQHLLDQVADVVVVARRRRCGRGRRNANGKSSVHRRLTSPSRASGVTTISSGVPVGAQIAWLSSSSSGCPCDGHARRGRSRTAR